MSLRSARLAKSLTLKQLGDQIGVHFATVQKWEVVRVPPERVPALAEVLGVTRHELRPDLYEPQQGAA